jgi:hypothetical protein
MKELEDLLVKSGFIKRSQIKNDFKDIESQIGFQLPDDYKYYLNNYEPFEGFIGKEYIVLHSAANLLELNSYHTFNESNTIIIGSNGASETIGIRLLDSNNYRIVIAQYIQDIDDQIEIGTSFSEMLKRLIEGIQWFQ